MAIKVKVKIGMVKLRFVFASLQWEKLHMASSGCGEGDQES